MITQHAKRRAAERLGYQEDLYELWERAVPLSQREFEEYAPLGFVRHQGYTYRMFRYNGKRFAIVRANNGAFITVLPLAGTRASRRAQRAYANKVRRAARNACR